MKTARRRRNVRRFAIVVVLAGAATYGGFVVLKRDPAAAPQGAPIFKTVEVMSGTLSTSEQIDGSVVLSESMNVLHRIDGQTSSATTAPAVSSTPSAFGNGAGAVAGTFLIEAVTNGAAMVAAAPLECATTGTTAAVAPPITVVVTVADTAPETTGPQDPAPVDPLIGEPTTTTVVPEPTATSTPVGSAPVDPNAAPLDCAATDDSVVVADGAAGSTVGVGGVGAIGGVGSFGGGAAIAPGSSTSSTTTARITQTITSVIGLGAAAGFGDVLYTVDGNPVVALDGVLPAWRTLSTSSDNGPDIQQLESSLVLLGYDSDGTVAVDNEFDSDTDAMVERWQEGLGVEVTGEITLGSVVFLPATTTVSNVAATVGDTVSDGSTILTLAAATQEVVIDIPDGAETFIVAGLEVAVGGGTGMVSLLRSTERDGVVVVQAVITPSAPIDGATNGTTVTVTVAVDNLDDVLVVPADALLSRLDGTYSLQIQAADGAVSWHTVEVLGISGSKVGVRGDGVTAGALVLVPE